MGVCQQRPIGGERKVYDAGGGSILKVNDSCRYCSFIPGGACAQRKQLRPHALQSLTSQIHWGGNACEWEGRLCTIWRVRGRLYCCAAALLGGSCIEILYLELEGCSLCFSVKQACMCLSTCAGDYDHQFAGMLLSTEWYCRWLALEQAWATICSREQQFVLLGATICSWK